MNTEKTQKVFLWTGTVAHLVDPTQPLAPGDVPERAPALCRTKPFWPGAWFGMTNGDRAKAESLPLCRICVNVKEAYASEPA
jgi:hypothetical protein